jgi:sphingosine kinase
MESKDFIELYQEISGINKLPIELTLKKKMLLFINPFGGRGTAIKVWNQVKHIFDLANIEIEIFKTRYYKHAYDHVLVMDVKQYQGILCCSGDGIVHEVINAMMSREDKDICLNSIALGVIPGGSSNGLAKTLCEESGEHYSPEVCSYLIVKGQHKKIDLMEIETQSGKKIYAFLAIGYGIIADVDLESEKYFF